VAVLVRLARVDDAAAIAALDVASWRAAYRDLMPRSYLDALSVEEQTQGFARGLERDAKRGKRTLVAEDEGTIAGYAVVGPDAGSSDGLLFLMYVAPDRWGTGTARALMRASRAALLELGYRRAALWVLEDNSRARRFYEADGWSRDEQQGIDDYGGTRLRKLRMVTEVAHAG
jgi:GNAT superfamily N-acetyltransferase